MVTLMSDSAVLPRPIAREASRAPVTIDQLVELEAQGAFKGKRTQLLDGEIHVMAHDGLPHINYAMRMARRIGRTLDEDRYFVGVQTSLHLSLHNAPSPDLYVLSAGPLVKETPPERILLVVEVADSSLRDDLTDSASRYARHGVREFWVVDVENRITYVHREPKDSAYPPPKRVRFEDGLAPSLIEGLQMRLADFDPPA